MKIKIKLLHEDAILPKYAHPDDAGMDLFAIEDTTFMPGEIKPVKSGIAVEIPKGHVGLIWDKSGIGVKEGLKVMGGVIDSGYRGEILIGMANISKKSYVFEKGHKVAQMLVQKIERPSVVLVNKLSETKRGHGALGSTGK